MEKEKRYVQTEFSDSKIRTLYCIRLSVEDIVKTNQTLLAALKLINNYYKQQSLCD